MKYKIVDWSPTYTYITHQAIIDSVIDKHLSNFPKDFFKTKWVDNKRSIQNIYKDEKYLNDLKLPAVIISYEIDEDPKNTYEQADWDWNYPSNYIAGGPLSTFYWKIFSNPETMTSIYVGHIRNKITLNFKYLFADYYQRDDMYTWIRNTMSFGFPDSAGNNNFLYSVLPSNMLNYLMNIEGFDPNNKTDVNTFSQELICYSKGRFRKRKLTMKDDVSMFVLVYDHPYMQITEANYPEKDDGEFKGQTKTNYGITETVEFEPYIPQCYYTHVPEVIRGKMVSDYHSPSSASNTGIDDRLLKSRNYSYDAASVYLNKYAQFTIVSSIDFSIDSTEPEVIDIDDELYGIMHLDIIKNLIQKKQDINQFYKIFIFSYTDKLIEDIDYTVDWVNKKITILHPKKGYNYNLVSTCRRNNISPYLQNKTIGSENFDILFPDNIPGKKPFYHNLIVKVNNDRKIILA